MSSANTLYSFVLLTYNQEKFVAEAVRGALTQQCPPIEILISDDCSCDATFNIIQEIAAEYNGPHKIILNRNNTNLGLVRHIDKIHELASGDVIIWASGDDISRPNRCQKVIDCFESEHPLLVFSHAEVLDLNGEPGARDYQSATLYKTKNIIKAARSAALYLGATAAWHRSLYKKYGPIEEGAYEDLVLGFRAALEGRFCILPEDLIIYRLGFGITSTTLNLDTAEKFKSNRLKNIRVMKAVLIQRQKDALRFGYMPKTNLLNVINRELLRSDIGLTYYTESRTELQKMFLHHPFLTLARAFSERKKLWRHMRKLTIK
jgi:glycosyltransferase involved in cell wall biosynthesis